MKSLTNFLLVFILIISCINNLCQDIDDPMELYLHNSSTTRTVNVKIYPVSMLISGAGEYCLLARRPLNSSERRFDYITSVFRQGTSIIRSMDIGPSISYGLNYDGEGHGSAPEASRGTFGRGIYKIVYSWYENGWNYDTVWFEQDGGENLDTRIFFVEDASAPPYGGNEGPGLVYQVYQPQPWGWGEFKAVTLANSHLKIWDPYPFQPNAYRRNKNSPPLLVLSPTTN